MTVTHRGFEPMRDTKYGVQSVGIGGIYPKNHPIIPSLHTMLGNQMGGKVGGRLLGFRALIARILRRADAQDHTQERVNRRNGADDLLAIWEAPDAGKSEVESAESREKILRNPLQFVVTRVGEHIYHPFLNEVSFLIQLLDILIFKFKHTIFFAAFLQQAFIFFDQRDDVLKLVFGVSSSVPARIRKV